MFTFLLHSVVFFFLLFLVILAVYLYFSASARAKAKAIADADLAIVKADVAALQVKAEAVVATVAAKL